MNHESVTNRAGATSRAEAGALAGTLPKHSLVADALTSEIVDGKYAIGGRLPSETQLSQHFGVSRQTVRAALRTLQQLGLVSSQQGVGTVVRDTRVQSRYSHSLGSAEDLLQYATSTRVKVLDREEIEVGEALAAQFGCRPGEHWWRVRTLRLNKPGLGVVAYSEIHIPLAFGAILKEPIKSSVPLFMLIEQRFNERIEEIQQEITCIARLSTHECGQLELAPGSAGMEITRRYIGRNGRVVEVARSVHPPGLFKYSMRVQLNHGTTT
jgi:GntR family transcriptional regulator